METNIKKKYQIEKKNISTILAWKSEVENILFLKEAAFIHFETTEGLSVKFRTSLFSFQHNLGENVFLKRVIIKSWVIMVLVLFISFIKLRTLIVIVTNWIWLLRIKFRWIWWEVSLCWWNIVWSGKRSAIHSGSLEFFSFIHTLSVLFVHFLDFFLLLRCPCAESWKIPFEFLFVSNYQRL